MGHTAVTVLAGLRPDTDVPALDALLADIGRNIEDGSGHPLGPDFGSIPGLHFLRLLIIKDPDVGADRVRLLFAAVVDGEGEECVKEFLENLRDATPDIDVIWGDCENYSEAEGFVEFMQDHAVQPSAFYVAFRDETVDSIRAYDALQKRFERISDGLDPGRFDESPRWRRRAFSLKLWLRKVWRRLIRPITVIPQIRATLKDADTVAGEYGFWPGWAAATTIVRGLNRYFGWWLFNMVFFNIERRPKGRRSQAAIDKLNPPFPEEDMLGYHDVGGSHPAVEDRVVQNQLTLITKIANKPRLNQLGATLAAVDSYSRVWATPGNLLGMSTIHFVRWMPIDNGRRLLMLSDYDHSWEAYIDEFIEMIRTGMDAIWSCAAETEVPAYKTGPSEEYLADYLRNGCGDAAMFKQFLRAHQAHANIFYSAYPRRTVMHTREDRERFRNVDDEDFYEQVMEDTRNAEV